MLMCSCMNTSAGMREEFPVYNATIVKMKIQYHEYKRIFKYEDMKILIECNDDKFEVPVIFIQIHSHLYNSSTQHLELKVFRSSLSATATFSLWLHAAPQCQDISAFCPHSFSEMLLCFTQHKTPQQSFLPECHSQRRSSLLTEPQ